MAKPRSALGRSARFARRCDDLIPSSFVCLGPRRRADTVLRKKVVAGGKILQEAWLQERGEFKTDTLNDCAALNEKRIPVLEAFGVKPD